MTEKEEIITALQNAGIAPETELCFEKLCDIGYDYAPFASVKNAADYFLAAQDFIRETVLSFARKGVRFASLDGVIISPLAEIGEGTVIYPSVQIRHGAKIGKNCVITTGSVIENSTVGDNCVINATQIYDSVLEDDIRIGPFSHVRPDSHIHSGVRIGDFVEVKNSDVGENTHASHLTYIGDSDVGKRVNFGCGTVTSNYDGIHKHRTVIGDDAFIGCNTNLVAPVKIGDGAYTAAGSTITEDVPADALAIARSRQTVREGWAAERKIKEKKN